MARANGQTGEESADHGSANAVGSTGHRPPGGELTKENQWLRTTVGQLIVSEYRLERRVVRNLATEETQWFVGADVCRGLGLAADKRSFAAHLAKLDDDEKTQISSEELGSAQTSPGLNPRQATEGGDAGREQEMPDGPPRPIWLVSESGLYTLILRSRDATTPGTFPYRFRRWLTHEVLPAIRKTGHYGGPRITYGSFEPDDTPPGRYVSLVGRDGEWHHYYSPYDTVRNDMDAEDARTLAHGIKIIEGFWRKLQPLHGDQPDLLQSYAWHALGRAVRSAAEDADQLIAMHESRRLRQPDH